MTPTVSLSGSASRSDISAQIDFESEGESVLRIRERDSLDLRYGHRDVQRIDDEEEGARQLQLHTEKAHAGVRPQASRWGPVEIAQQVRGAEADGGPQVEVFVCQRKPEHRGAEPGGRAGPGRGAVQGQPRIPLPVQPKCPVLAEMQAQAKRTRQGGVVER